VKNVGEDRVQADSQASEQARQREQREREIQEERNARAEKSVKAAKDFFAFIAWTGLIAIVLGAATVVALKWRAILYFIYSLTPHPAASVVKRVIATGEELDGPEFARLTRIEGHNDIERAVRSDQVRALIWSWRANEAALKKEDARLLEARARRLARENARTATETALLEAAIAHERAAARVAERRKQEPVK
jgi:hypothetical protein